MIFVKYKPTSLFGNRTLANGDSRLHNGIDLVGVKDKSVLSPVDGIIITSTIITDKNNQTWEWGNYVCVESQDGHKHYFCHLASRCVVKGQRVSKGDILGVMGNTGYSFGAHTHYGIRDRSNKWLDPAIYHNLNLIEGRTYELETEKMSIEKAITILKEKANVEEKTINFLLCYKYGEDLMIKLAKAM